MHRGKPDRYDVSPSFLLATRRFFERAKEFFLPINIYNQKSSPRISLGELEFFVQF